MQKLHNAGLCTLLCSLTETLPPILPHVPPMARLCVGRDTDFEAPLDPIDGSSIEERNLDKSVIGLKAHLCVVGEAADIVGTNGRIDEFESKFFSRCSCCRKKGAADTGKLGSQAGKCRDIRI